MLQVAKQASTTCYPEIAQQRFADAVSDTTMPKRVQLLEQ